MGQSDSADDMKEITFRTRRGAMAWSKTFYQETGFILLIRRDRTAQVFSRTKGCWVLEVREDCRDLFAETFGAQPSVINQ